MREKVFITTDNIFADLGLKNDEELRTRSDLMSEVASIIRNSDLSQKEIAKILDISAPKVSALMTGKINDFSNDTLMCYLTLLRCNMNIADKINAKKQSSNDAEKIENISFVSEIFLNI